MDVVKGTLATNTCLVTKSSAVIEAARRARRSPLSAVENFAK